MDTVKDQAPTNQRLSISLVAFTTTHISLRNNLWFDTATCVILRKGKRIPLTARETRLLRALLDAPNCFHSADMLARLLTPPGTVQIDPHCLEQSLYGLRRKLGEDGRHPRLLLNRRNIGYGLFLPKIASAEQGHAPQPRQGQARKRSKT